MRGSLLSAGFDATVLTDYAGLCELSLGAPRSIPGYRIIPGNMVLTSTRET